MDLATLMYVSYRAMDERVLTAMRAAGYDITAAQSRIAQRIDDEGSRLTDLAERAQVTKQTASQLVVALERQGLVERVPDPADGRARLIRFTERGRAAAQEAMQVVIGVEQEWAEHLGPRMTAQLRAALARLREVTDPYA
ncbi:MarR family transcriptional regulator [Nocardioides sp. Root122]|jgi:DNA-binding MarR family transcriptional regulator|uniref:MarR family winged helix-turn-helix transcriptional regulator n=1 Tax=Nocardioides TaxID=1839 RepID=UPI0007039ACD|nr:MULTISPECIES: MarR family transcriptional regulator [Nocardioides]KQV63368.1 MarR family transcriptional regulator [Nocardioides sp. Root122]MCK9825531.1 MarR family transcriptional regulator [Nocardioides cavernae]